MAAGTLESEMLRDARYRARVILVKVPIALLALVLGLYASIGCSVAHATLTIEAPCCGNNCPMRSAMGESACCHAQDSGAAAREISRPSIPVAQPLVGFMRVSVIVPARTAFEQAFLLHGSPPGAFQLALLCSRQI